jgi:diguanylate cyclase (GGDEF)-like protein
MNHTTIESKKSDHLPFLPKILSPGETWMFSLAGLVWSLMTITGSNNTLGLQSLYVWIPGIIFGSLYLFQIKQMGLLFPNTSGGMSGYTSRLFNYNPVISKYATWAYYISWAGVPAVYPLILSKLIEINLSVFGIQINMLPIQLLLLTLGFIIGAVSTKALATMQTFFTIPAFIVTFIFLSSGTLLISTGKITPIVQDTSLPDIGRFLIWMFITSYITYTGESTAVFAGESINPQKTLHSLTFTAFLKPFVYIIGVFLMGYTVPRGMNFIPSQAIEMAGVHIFGSLSSNIATALVVSSLLLSTTLTVALAPRVLYQLAQDKLANPLLAFLSQNGTPRVGILFTFIIALVTFFIGSLDKIFIGTGASFLASIIIFHIGLIINRKEIKLKMVGFTVFTVVCELVMLLIGGLLLDWVSVLVGLVVPFLFILVDSFILPSKPILFLHKSFSKFYHFATIRIDSISTVVAAVIIVMFMSSGVSWVAASFLTRSNFTQSINLYISAIIILTFLSVAIVGISIIPQVIQLFKQKTAIEIVNGKLGETLEKYSDSIKKLEDLAYVDQLTRLNNFNQTTSEIEKSIALFQNDGDTYCFCIVDIDRFKIVNDSLGYAIGDSLLKQIGMILKGISNTNITISRIGGDEFGILIRNFTSKKYVETLLQEVIEKISNPIELFERTLFVTSCIGVVYGSSDYKTGEQIYQCANIAKHKAKMYGKNQIQTYTKILKKEVVDLEKLERELRNTVKQKSFEVYFQPIYDLKNKQISMVESLIRWFKPDGTSVPPSLFIPLAEETGLINEITWWSLRESFKQGICIMKKMNRKIKICVNVSPELFKNHELSSRIQQVAKEEGFDLENLVVEITEYMILNNSGEILQKVSELQKLGIKVSLDDFGTGYSNLQYLINLHVDEIKIDKSFTNNLNTFSGKYIAQTMTELSAKLNMKVVYEGVETIDELKTIIELEGNYIQGYLFSRPENPSKLNFEELEKNFSSYL